MLGNKKGSALDLVYFVIGAFVLAIFLLIVWQMWAAMSPTLQATLGPSAEVNASIEAGTQVTNMFDLVFLGGVIAIFLVMVILAMLIAVSPVFYIVYFMYLIVAVLLAPSLSNMYEGMTNTSAELLYNASQAMPMQTYFMANLPLLILMFGIVVIIITYAKFGTGGGAGR